MNKIQIFPAWIVGICFCSVLLWSCDEERGKNGQKADTPVSGNIKISVDESLRPFADGEVKTFMQIYTRAKIDASYKSESESLEDMFKDTARVVIIPRQLTEEEKKFYTDKKRIVKSVLIAYDAVALIVNNKNPDSTLSISQLNDIMHGKINDWKQLGGIKGKMTIVFDNPTSSTLHFMKTRFNIKDTLPNYFRAAKTNEEVINYVEQTPNALGFIGVSWIGSEDSMPNSFLKRIKVMSLTPPDTAKGTEQKYYPPFQAWIKTGYYPLVRNVYAITPEFFNGLGSGFIDFMAGDKGQIKVLQSGLVPATMPVRMIKARKE